MNNAKVTECPETLIRRLAGCHLIAPEERARALVLIEEAGKLEERVAYYGSDARRRRKEACASFARDPRMEQFDLLASQLTGEAVAEDLAALRTAAKLAVRHFAANAVRPFLAGILARVLPVLEPAVEKLREAERHVAEKLGLTLDYHSSPVQQAAHSIDDVSRALRRIAQLGESPDPPAAVITETLALLIPGGQPTTNNPRVIGREPHEPPGPRLKARG